MYKKGSNIVYIFTFSLQLFLHAKTTKVLEIVLSQDILVVFHFYVLFGILLLFKNIKNRGKLMLFDLLSSILFVG